MHPAYSVIAFTVGSGAGFGLLAALAFAILTGPAVSTRGFYVCVFALAFVFAIGGLLASTLHLGRPERAWRAFSQWRTSWLSREGVAAVAALACAGGLALAAVLDAPLGVQRGLAAATLGLAGLTVWCTGMIYESLTTIRAWNHRLVTEIYLVLAAASGAALYHLCLTLAGGPARSTALASVALLAFGGILKFAYWRSIDDAARPLTAGDATGLGHLGRVRALDPPHTQANYIMREMGFVVARRHARKLRRIALGVGFVLPIALLASSLVAGVWLGAIAALAACVAMLAGLLVERWLFFAEAQHVVTLYYGAERA